MLAMWQESLEVLFILANIYLCSNLVSFTKVLSSLISEASFITRRWRKGVQKEQTDPEYRIWELENPWPSSPASFPVKAFSGIALKENYMVSAGPLWDQVAKWRWYGSFYLPMITFLSQKRNSEGWDWGEKYTFLIYQSNSGEEHECDGECYVTTSLGHRCQVWGQTLLWVCLWGCFWREINIGIDWWSRAECCPQCRWVSSIRL